ncbi:MAG: hypothetical protein ABI091_05305 [Ferruginibacter sp.]
MNCQQIEEIINELKVNSLGSIRGKNRATDKIHSLHLKDIDNALMEVRIFVARLPNGYSSNTILKMIDEFIYKLQIK